MTVRLLTILICVAIMAIALIAGGPQHATDPAIIGRLLEPAANDPKLTPALTWITQGGSAPALLALTLLAAISLFATGRRRDAMLLAAIVLGGRIATELTKLLVARPRPDLVPYPVTVTSFSFPSAHAANSMTTFLALALVLAPPTRRRPAIAAALLASLVIGLTRPMLGVHWPSDVVAGWAFGIAWVTAFAPPLNRRGETSA